MFLSRVASLFETRHREAELTDEIQAHLDLLAEAHVRDGMAPAEARAAAHRDFGGVEQIKETYRDERGLPFIDALRQDLRFAIRTFLKAPGLTLVVVVTLALGIGANTATFSVLNAVLLRPLPVPEPAQLFVVSPPTPTAVPQRVSFPMFERLRAATPAPAAIASNSRVASMYAVINGGEPERASVHLVSGEYFSTLGVAASAGRLFTPSDNRVAGGHPVAVISDQWWRRRFGAAPDVVGRSLTVNGTTMTIVGIAQAGFSGTWVDTLVDLWIPLVMQHDLRYAQNYSSHDGDDTRPFVEQENIEWLQVIGRASPADWDRVGAALKLAYQQGVAQQAAPYSQDSLTRAFFLQQRIALEPFSRGASNQRARLTPPLFALLAMVVLVLLIACGNTANLLLARASARRREIAIRLSMGASRGRLVRQLLTESTMLAAVATGGGIAIARWFAAELMRNMTRNATSAAPDILDVRVLAFTAVVSIATALLFGFLPALRTVDVAVADTLRVDTRTMAAGARFNARQALVACQVALSLVLVVGAALSARSVQYLSHVDLGFDAEHVMSVAINTRAGRYPEAALSALHARLIARVESLPGVRSAAASECQLVAGCRNSSGIRIDGYQPRDGERVNVLESHVGLRYFSTVGIRLAAGRDFGERDRAPCKRKSQISCDRPAAAIINQAMATRFFSERGAIGRIFRYGTQDIEIVGIVEDARVSAVQEPSTPMAFYPLRDSDVHAAVIEVAAIGDPVAIAGELRKALLEVEPALPVSSVRTLSEQVSRNIDQERFVAGLTAAFGLLALGLASFGLFGVMSYSVARRTPELGVRLALGAPPLGVLWMVFRESLVLVAIGIGAGLPMVFGASRAIAGMLIGVGAADPATIAGASGVLLAVASAAAFLPAWRASRVDPMVALRHE
jgi:predicted permease